VARHVRRGEIWLYTFKKPNKQRPVVILTREEVIGLLHTVTVAPITSPIHGAPSEVTVGVEHGFKHDSAVNLDHLTTVDRSQLRTYIGRLAEGELRAVCRAAAIALGCRQENRAPVPWPSTS